MTTKGYIDLQVNGYEGVDFSSPSLTLADISKVSRRMAELGTAAYCPTVITTSWETYSHVLPLLADAMGNQSEDEARILGIHLEGPYISPEKGAVGAHPKEWVRQPSTSELDQLLDLAKGNIKILTVAPEIPGMPDLIRHAVQRNVRVSLGHTLATEDDVAQAADAGATLCTHLGNACPNELHRHHNPIWAQLGSDLTIMMITDGHHLPPSLIRTFIKSRPAGKLIVTSDLSPAAGCSPGIHTCFNSQVRVTDAGRIEDVHHPNLAGSSCCMRDCIDHLRKLGYTDEAFLDKVGRQNALAVLEIE